MEMNTPAPMAPLIAMSWMCRTFNVLSMSLNVPQPSALATHLRTAV